MQQDTAKTPDPPDTPNTPDNPQTPGWKKPEPLMQDGNRMIFVGNSHTYVNDLPGLFQGLAEAAGHTIEVYECSEGAYYLKLFADPEDEMGSVLVEALESESWDFVALQENTNGAIDADEEMKEPARKLDTLIKAADGQHASPAGAYLAACTAYAILFQETPAGIPFYGEVREAEAQKLQQIAADSVLGSSDS